MTGGLNDSFARVARAEQHIAQLQEELRCIGRLPEVREAYREWVSVSGTGRHQGLSDETPIVGLPHLGIRVGECVYNLRAALDYLVHQLVMRDKVITAHLTQFPITGSPEKAMVSPQVDGMFEGHKRMIADMQSPAPSHWLNRLQTLSNPDKHDAIQTVLGAGEVLVTRFQASSDGMPIDFEVPLRLVFRPRTGPTFEGSVVETLVELEAEVLATLERFKPCFDGNCGHWSRPRG